MFKGDQRDEKELARKQVRGQVLQVKEQVEGPESPEGRRRVEQFKELTQMAIARALGSRRRGLVVRQPHWA